MSTSTVILARILQSVNFSIYRYILGNTNTVVCSDIGNTNTSIHPVSYCPIWDEAVLIPDLKRERVSEWVSVTERRTDDAEAADAEAVKPKNPLVGRI